MHIRGIDVSSAMVATSCYQDRPRVAHCSRAMSPALITDDR